MNTLANIIKWTQLAMAGALVAETTMASDTGQSKQKFVVDMVNNEAQIAGLAAPIAPAFANSIVNIVVAGFNLAGLFTHKAPAAPAS